ncbi:MAG: glycoside hydrolase family 2 [Acidobacteria bacterium]|nr:glycoside hydrolase family 2 [Acidobacteriota bacterium]
MRTTAVVVLGGSLVLSAACGTGVKAPTSRALAEGWFLRAAATCNCRGDAVSRAGFEAAGWLPARVPTTVMAAEAEQGRFPDLYVGTNLDKVPTEPYQGPWWYRTEFELTREEAGRAGLLILDGVNYSAEVWLNGVLLAGRNEVKGAFRVHRLDLTGMLVAGRNALALEVHPPQPGDYTIGFVDWNPRPPDRNMGIWRPVHLRLTGDVALGDVFVSTDVDTETLASAELRVQARLANRSARPATATVTGAIGDIRFSTDFELAAGESREVVFSPERVPALRLASPRLWWPYTLGTPDLYRLRLEASVGGRTSDVFETDFGIREVATYLNEQGHRGYTVNGVPILIRGGGWVDDLLLADTRDRLKAQIAYVKHMGLNTIRLEGFWGSGHELYDLADREGILLMAGWSCQWEWENYLGKPVDERYGGVTKPDEIALVTRSLGDQVRYLRNHPSIVTWVLASDLLPHPDLERSYRAMLANDDPTRPALVSCAWLDSEVSGPSGVKMKGPYDWVPPVYWFADRERGGAYGFNTETGPGPQPPPLESVRRMIPPDHLWPVDAVWEYHCGRGEFNTLERYNRALDSRYGPSSSVEEYLRKSQVANYEAMRPMLEAFAINRPNATGVIQWMLNSAWPDFWWQLYDAYLVPTGAFYGARAACRPQALAYNYADGGVWAHNDTREPLRAVATVRAFDLDAREIFSARHPIEVPGGSSRSVVSLAGRVPGTPVWFLDLRLTDPGGRELARNFYWLPQEGDVLDPAESLWYVTPVKRHADLTALARLPEARLAVEASATGSSAAGVRVRLANPTSAIAFFVELRALDAAGNTIVPVLWDDNYVSLLPGEARELVARLPLAGGQSPAKLELSGWNVPVTSVVLAPEPAGTVAAGGAHVK